MTFCAENILGEEVYLSTPVAVTINQEEDVPADDLTVVFPFEKRIYELVLIYVRNDGDETIFKGIVDEQIIVSTAKGAFLKIVARSMAAPLLDNEAKPENYTMPPTKLIYDQYVRPWGIEPEDLENDYFWGDFTVEKGKTNWQVINSFCQNMYGVQPRVTAQGKMQLRGIKNDEKLVFTNKQSDVYGDKRCIAYLDINEYIKRYSLISEIVMKTNNSTGYDTVVKDKDLIDRKIRSRRYINANLQGVTPASYAYKILEQSKKDSYEVTITSPQSLLGILGAEVMVCDNKIGELKGLYVCKLKYILSSSGEKTIITLRKRV